MTDRPIIFSAPMVRALLADRKTMTRRIVKPQPGEGYAPAPNNMYVWTKFEAGDRLWVKEKYALKSVGWYYETDIDGTVPHAWRNSMFMPRAASRLTLLVTSVKIERLHDINSADAQREGVDVGPLSKSGARFQFRELWDSIHGDGAWDKDPWVVAVGFSIHRTNIDRMPA